MRRTWLALAGVVLALALSACGGSSAFAGHRLTKDPWPASPLTLTDTEGAPYSLAKNTRSNKLTLVFFGYTHCPDLCPLVMNNLAAAFNRLDATDRSETGMVFITSDPARDTESVLRHYLDGYNTSFEGLTGPLPRIIKVGKPFYVSIDDGKRLPSGGYDTGGHTPWVYGLEDGKAVAFWRQDTSATQYASDIHTLLSEDS